MSKEAALRAMREARHDQRSARSATPSAPVEPVARPAKAKEKEKAPRTDASPAATDALCGHRSMNGRTCTREQGHAAKNHRYS